MHRWKKILVIAILLPALVIAAHLFWLSHINGSETYPTDTFLDSVSNKTALIVVAHDDDAIGCAGTVSELTKKGWKIHFLAFYGQWRKEDNPTRKKEVATVAGIQHLASTILVDYSIQKSDTVKEPWMPIPYDRFAAYYQVDSIRVIIAAAIDTYKPSVLFTLDTVIGGYGHPEHVCVSQAALDVCKEQQQKAGFTVRKIYQAVFTRTLNEHVLKNNPAFIAAKKVYGAEGSPVPNTEINISHSSKEKKAVMLAYESQKRNLIKIWPYYNFYPHWIYFKIFSKEYFHTINVQPN